MFAVKQINGQQDTKHMEYNGVYSMELESLTSFQNKAYSKNWPNLNTGEYHLEIVKAEIEAF